MIKTVTPEYLPELLPLIKEYQSFYGVTNIGAEQNRQFFSQFGNRSDKGCQFVYLDKSLPVAFATVYFSYSSTLAAKVAILNDLYTQPAYRHRGIAAQLIEHCAHYAIHQGAHRLQWVTARENTEAQALYKKIGAKQSSWEFFSYIPQTRSND